MGKSTITYWNTLSAANADKWQTIADTDNNIEELTLAIDVKTGDYTRLTRFKVGSNTKNLGGKSHDYPEEVYIISGKLYDAAFDMWLEAGYFASRPPHEVHGPFICAEECLVLEISFPSQAV